MAVAAPGASAPLSSPMYPTTSSTVSPSSTAPIIR